MKLFNSKKKLVAGAVALVATAGLATGAFAYWTSTGSGTGSATTDTASSSLVITDATSISNLAPGVAAGSVHGSIKNNNAAGGQNAYVNTVTASISGVTGPNITVGTPCDDSDYTLSTPVMSVATDLAPQASASFSGATLAFNDKPTTNQDGCQGATVALHFASN